MKLPLPQQNKTAAKSPIKGGRDACTSFAQKPSTQVDVKRPMFRCAQRRVGRIVGDSYKGPVDSTLPTDITP
jgi:hypothetical protein